MPSEDFKAKIDKSIEKVFENAYIERLQNIYDRSREAQALDRRRMYYRLKRYLFKSRCVTYGAESWDK